ncbi:hypothetical protein ACIRCZ_19775 [Leifsonia sp. NPDC102414]|uniref:hypothetical protein n=1 Tax=Leifsonia sp. NPDC102414 TaxID=3364124 RepID=UPI00381B3B09
MPKFLRPESDDWSDEVALAAEVFRTPVRLVLLTRLRDQGPQTRSELVNGSGFDAAPVARSLSYLESVGLVEIDVPAGQRLGRPVRYALDRRRWNDLVIAFKRYLGEAQ